MRRPERHAILTDRRLLAAVAFAAAFLAFPGPLAAYDVWWHLRAGRLIVATGSVPQADPFSFTAYGRPWTYHSWLAGLVLTGAHALGGAAGLIVLRALLIAAALFGAWRLARGRGVGVGPALVLVLAACLQLKTRALARPYLFSFVLFVVFAAVLQAAFARPVSWVAASLRLGRRRGEGLHLPWEGAEALPWLAVEDAYLWGVGGRLLALPLLTVLWANLHAGFISGLLVIGAYGAGEAARLCAVGGPAASPRALLKGREGARLRAMLVAGVLCLAGSVVTPAGPGTLLYPFRLLREVTLVRRVQEWQPMPLSAELGVFWAMLVFGALVILRSAWLCARGGRLREQAGQVVTDALLMGGFAVLALQAVRHMAWLLLLAPSVLGWHLQVHRRLDAEEVTSEPSARPVYAVAVYVLAFAVGLWPYLTGGPPALVVMEDRFPEGACEFIEREGLEGRLYNSYEWGGYLIWRGLPVFVDGRCLVYGDEIIGQAIAVEDGEEGWREVLARWDVRMLVLRYRKGDVTHLFAEGRWRPVYWDDAALVALREDVLAARADLPELGASNPVYRDELWERSSPSDVLRELEVVLTRDPTCWTALAMRARALARLAAQEPQRREELLGRAAGAAREAVRIQPDHPEPQQALKEVTAGGPPGPRRP